MTSGNLNVKMQPYNEYNAYQAILSCGANQSPSAQHNVFLFKTKHREEVSLFMLYISGTNSKKTAGLLQPLLTLSQK